jgi:hypothetical protein
MKSCFKAFLIINLIIVFLISGCFVDAKMKKEKANSDSPEGNYVAKWYGNDYLTSAYIIDKKTGKWSKSLWRFQEVHPGDNFICMDEGHFRIQEYQCFWRDSAVCVFTVRGTRMLGGESTYSIKCNAETLYCADITGEQNRIRQESRAGYRGP